MYYRIKENKLYDYAAYEYAEDAIFSEIDYETFDSQKYGIVEGKLTDISETPEYIALQAQKTKAINDEVIKIQIQELDVKRIRAYCEPEVKDEETGETWLEHYNKEIQALRIQLQ